MKNFFTLTLCFFTLSLTAQVEYPYPYNPDIDNNGFIGNSDLLELLSLYSYEFNAGVLATDSISAIYYTGQLDYWDCTSSCVGLEGNWKVLDHYLVGTYRAVLFGTNISMEGPNTWTWIDHFTSNISLTNVYTIGGWNNWNSNCEVCGPPYTEELESAELVLNPQDVYSKHNCYCQIRTSFNLPE